MAEPNKKTKQGRDKNKHDCFQNACGNQGTHTRLGDGRPDNATNQGM